MEETNERKWSVYMHINKINDKVYVGVAKGKPERRWGKDGCKYNGAQQVFANAIKKYGWDNFKHEILATNLTQREAWDMEIKLIAQYKSNCKRYKNPSFGYNMTDGGDGSSGFTHTEATKEKMKENHADISGPNNPHYGTGKPVVQLDFDGNYISEYISCIEASKQTGITASAIYGCCKGTYLSVGGFMWKYKDEYNPEEVSRYIHPHFRQVVQLSMCGEYIAEHDSMLLAEKATGVSKDAIKQCCNGQSKFAGNFVWRDKDKYDPNEKFSYTPKFRAIVQLDLNGNFIAEYKQVKNASLETGIDSTHISSCCTGKRKSTGGFRWMYKEDYDKLTQQNDLNEIEPIENLEEEDEI